MHVNALTICKWVPIVKPHKISFGSIYVQSLHCPLHIFPHFKDLFVKYFLNYFNYQVLSLYVTHSVIDVLRRNLHGSLYAFKR